MMRTIYLVLEAATEHASVALIADGVVIADKAVPARRPETGERTEGIVPAVVNCFAETGVTSHDLTAILCSGGPGGFTSLRTAASIAKGMCSALAIPLYAVPTLELIVAGADRADGRYVAALDAGRGEFYASAIVVADGAIQSGTPVRVVAKYDLDLLVGEEHATLVGPAADVDAYPRAPRVLRLLDRVLASGPVDIDTWEPAYGRLAEAQVKWEATHGRPLAT